MTSAPSFDSRQPVQIRRLYAAGGRDDEFRTTKAPGPTYAQGALALDFRLSSGVPAVPAAPALAVLPGGRSRCSTPAGLPDVRDWAARFVQAVAEVIGGDRPVTQLIRWTDHEVYLDVSRRVRILGVTSTASTRSRVNRPQVRSVHICQPLDGVAEVAVHIRHGARSRAVAARLEVVRDRWLCTALELA
ncbi:MAG TPA: Rv3235 family protein [Nocardioidaceae bacterium]|jgi:hypothetical protein|nr:Rv3235 family protein [Nocardioidaceae bacterium]